MKKITTNNAPKALGPYSQAVVANGFVFVSGQIPIDPITNEFVSGDIKDLTRMCIKNIENILLEAGSKLENIVKVSIFLQNLEDFADVNEAYAEYFNQILPARVCVEVARLPKDAKVEIEAIATV